MEKIGKYKIIGKIGRGGMGVVYKALDPRIERVVAIKTLSAHLDSEPEIRSRFLQEARSAGALSHKNIITIFEMDEDQGVAYLAMEFLDGSDLKALISQRTWMSLEEKLRILLEVSEGLAHAHSMGIIHRDIKPGNIFITRTGQVKILDFGLARVMSSEITRTGVSMGTPSYMSPEQVRGEKLDHRSDLFSLGVVAYELLTYSKPFQAESDYATTFKITQSDPDPIDTLDPALPKELWGIIEKALAKNPDGRQPLMEDFIRDLEFFRLWLEDRKRSLREEVKEAVTALENFIQPNREYLKEAAEKLEEMKKAAPELLGAGDSSMDDYTRKRRALQIDYLALTEMRDRARMEYPRLETLVDKRKKARYLLQEVRDLQRNAQFASALQITARILEDDPTYAEVDAIRTDLEHQLAEQERALENLRRVEALHEKARTRFDEGDYAGCESILAEALEIDPQHAPSRTLLISAREKILELEALAKKRESVRQLLAKSRALLASAEFARALEEAGRADTILPDNPETLALVAQIEEAERRERTRKERELRVRTLLDEANAHFRAGDEEGAVQCLEELIGLEPGHTEAAEFRKAIENRRQDRLKAASLFERAARKFAEGDFASCTSFANEALLLNPEHTEAAQLRESARSRIAEQRERERRQSQAAEVLGLARKALAVKNFALARSEAERARSLAADLSGVAEFLDEIHQSEAAEQERIEREKKVTALLELANSYHKGGDNDQALVLVQESLELQPGHLAARQLKREIETSLKAMREAARAREERLATILSNAVEAEHAGNLEKSLELARSIAQEPDAPAEIPGLIERVQESIRKQKEEDKRRQRQIAQLLAAARQAISARKYPEAVQTLENVFLLQPDHPEAATLRRQAQDEIDAERAREQRRTRGEDQKSTGFILLSQGKYHESLAALRNAAELLGEEASLRSAIDSAQEGIRAEELRARIQSGLVEARHRLAAQAYEESRKILLEVLKISPENAEAMEMLGQIEQAEAQKSRRGRIASLLAQSRQFLAQGDFKEASRTASEVLLLDERNADAKELLDKIDQTQQERSRRVEIAGLLAQSSQALARRDFQEAAVHARAALLLDDRNTEAKELLKRIDEAQEAKHKRERIASLFAEVRTDRMGGQFDAAASKVREILRLEPHNSDAATLLKELKREIRTAEKEAEREKKRQKQLQRQAAAGTDATIILPSQTGIQAWIRSPARLAIVAAGLLILGAAAYFGLNGLGGMGELTVVADQAGVSILLDDAAMGVTTGGPFKLGGIQPGPHKLIAQKEGFAEHVAQLDIERGKNPDLVVALKPVTGELRVKTDQAGVRVQIDGRPAGETAADGSVASFRVGAGRHAVILFKEGFKEVRQELDFAIGSPTDLNVNLEAIEMKTGMAMLRVISNPADATVLLDGKRAGVTTGGSLTLQDLSPGPVKVLVTKQGYGEVEKNITLEAGKALDLPVTLAGQPASLVLTTNVPEAEVQIDNTRRGTTDAAGKLSLSSLAPESRILKVRKDGYQEGTELLNLKPGTAARVELNLKPLPPAAAALSVNSSPGEAEVYIDDEFKGMTPITNIRVAAGMRKIRVKKEGYRDTERTVEFKAGMPQALPFTLEKMQGRVEFAIQPEGVIARIAGRTYDTARQKAIDLDPGNYTVEISEDGYKPFQRSITVQDRQTIRFAATLEKSAPALAGSYAEAFLTLDNWDRPGGWAADGVLRASQRGTGLLKDKAYRNFKENFQVRLTKGSTASWIVRYQDSKNYCLIQIHSNQHEDRNRRNTIQFSVLKDGQTTSNQIIPLPFELGKNRSEWVDIQLQVSGNEVVAKGSVVAGTSAVAGEMGRYRLPDSLSQGLVGFVVFGNEEFEINGLVVDPI